MNDSLYSISTHHHNGVRTDTNRSLSAETTEIQCRTSAALQYQDFPSKSSDEQCVLANCSIANGASHGSRPPTAACINLESTTAPLEVIGDHNASKESSIEAVTM